MKMENSLVALGSLKPGRLHVVVVSYHLRFGCGRGAVAWSTAGPTQDPCRLVGDMYGTVAENESHEIAMDIVATTRKCR